MAGCPIFLLARLMTVHGYSIYNRTKTYLILEVLSTCSLCNGDLLKRISRVKYFVAYQTRDKHLAAP